MCGGDVLKVALFEHRVFKHHGLHLQVEKPGERVIYINCSVLWVFVFDITAFKWHQFNNTHSYSH